MKHDWEIKKLGDVCKTGAGGTPLKAHKDYYEGGIIPWLLSGEVSQGEIYEANNFITPKGLENSSAKLFPKNTVLVAMYGATAGQVGILRFEASTNQAVCGIYPNKNTIPEFLYYYFLLRKDVLISQAAGNAQPNISQIKIKNTSIPIPPLAEQKSIVAKLDQCFEAIDKARANVERNLKNVKELFQSQLNQIFSQKGDGWVEKDLGKVCEVFNGFAFKSKDAVNFSNTQLLRMGNLYQNRLDLQRKPVYYPDNFANKYKEYLLSPKDLVMSLTGTVDKRDYGFTVEIPDSSMNLLLNQRIMKISIFDSNVLLKSYLHGYLLSPIFLNELYATAHGTRQANLSSKTILTLKIPFPISIQEQSVIVQKLDNLKDHTQSLTSNYQQELDTLDELKKSLLQKAFNGEL